ncbi:uncharacterized protein BX663DRAFT_513600 [Cokeromyces recurvatus]|uniref:uncharacterized protein n=1 Tax=Cokeromyces recurvatus TaxID=90255 RepID=UPI002220E12E|nr:uncharacterized protein BX663DRAFT_513600 [Cokeromyces recurvatus]KAI7901662.1 hypothetical protein BX663DRAFT_513600 [Cokeromyces recurvatus]
MKIIVWRQILVQYISPHYIHFTYEEYVSLLHLQSPPDRSSYPLFFELSTLLVFACIQQSV